MTPETNAGEPIVAGAEAAGQRLDQWLTAALGGVHSRSRLQTLIREGAVTVAGRAVTEPKHKLSGGERIEIAVPEHSVGDVTSDLSLRRGLVTGTSGLGSGTVAIGGQVPEAELADYQSRLNAMTSGQGRYTVALSHYEAVPPAVQQTLIGRYRVREDD